MVESPSSESIAGFVERVTFHSGDTGFAVLRVKVTGHRDLVTVVATLPSVSAGEWVEAQGRWKVNGEHGQQFQVWKIQTTQPNTAEGIEKYLASARKHLAWDRVRHRAENFLCRNNGTGHVQLGAPYRVGETAKLPSIVERRPL